MNLRPKLSDKFIWLNNSFYFFKRHFLVVTGLGLIAAFGRVIQLRGFGEISHGVNVIMEIIIESARIMIFLYVLGLASIRNGVLRIIHVLKGTGKLKLYGSVAIQTIKKQWLSVLLNITGFLLVAWFINYVIDLLAYQTCLLLTLKRDGLLSDYSSEWTILLFFKNLSVIPLTLIFDAVFLLWITNKWQQPKNLKLQ